MVRVSVSGKVRMFMAQGVHQLELVGRTGCGHSSRNSSVASRRLARASSTVSPWLTVPTSGHSAHGTGTTRVFVVTEVDQTHVVAWCMALA